MAARLDSVKSRLLPHGWLDLLRQFALLGLTYLAYTIVRGMVEGRAGAAFQHARDVINIERTLHLFVEPSIQAWATSSHFLMTTASWIYINAQTSVTLGALAYLYVVHNRSFYFVRNMFLIAMVLALTAYYVFPTAPPRFLPEWGFVDSVSDFTRVHTTTSSLSGSVGGSSLNPSGLVNLYAAVPSMHVAFALMIAWPLATLSRWRIVRGLWLLYPLLITFVIIVTANHFIADAILGALTALASAAGAHAVARYKPAWWRLRTGTLGAGVGTAG
jgi:hypothetical protein